VKDPSISRRHAEIRLGESILHVSDLQSLNGTFVDDVRADFERVSSGRLLRFGNVEFAVAVEDLDSILEFSEEETDNQLDRADVNGRCLQLLSDAQRRVFDLLVCGFAEKTIAKRLNLSIHTVHSHTKMIFKIFRVHSRARLLAFLLNDIDG